MSINYSNVTMKKLALHKVGNKQRNERNFTSEQLFDTGLDVSEGLRQFYLKAMRQEDTARQFYHGSSLTYNEMWTYAKLIFDDPDTFLETSKLILQHLYNQSNHPNIKSGDLHVAYFEDFLIDDEVVDAIGIFKTEKKHGFFHVNADENNITVKHMEGIRVDKLDKGCLIFNTRKDDGYVVLSVDNNNYDALYWLDNFLHVDFIPNDDYYTGRYMELAQEFDEDVMGEMVNPLRRLEFQKNVQEYFDLNEKFNFVEFVEKVCPDEETKAEMNEYRADFGLEEIDAFPIEGEKVKKRRKFKRKVKTDTNVFIDFGAEAEKYVERGYDEGKGMYFYKTFFNEEIMQ